MFCLLLCINQSIHCLHLYRPLYSDRLVPAEEGAGSAASEWELREREEKSRDEAKELGAAGELGAGEELPLFLPAPSFMASADKD